MGDGTINLPQVIQQSGDVSRLQEVVQRAGEQQQMAAAAEGLRQERHERASVQRSDRPGAQNRVRADQRGGGEPPPQRGRQAAGGKQGQTPDEPTAPPGGGGVLDVVV